MYIKENSNIRSIIYFNEYFTFINSLFFYSQLALNFTILDMDTTKLEHNVAQAAALLKALSNEKRLMIVCILNKGEQSVGELEKNIGLSQSALSQHLARLRRDSLVKTRRAAQTIYYSLGNHAVVALMDCLSGIYCDEHQSC